MWNIARCVSGATETLGEVDQQYVESLEMCCWRRMEKIVWTDRVGNEGVLYGGKGKTKKLHAVKKRKANWIGRYLA